MKKLLLSFGLLSLLTSCTADPICPTIEKKEQVLYRYWFTFDTGKKVEVHEIDYKRYNLGEEYCK